MPLNSKQSSAMHAILDGIRKSPEGYLSESDVDALFRANLGYVPQSSERGSMLLQTKHDTGNKRYYLASEHGKKQRAEQKERKKKNHAEGQPVEFEPDESQRLIVSIQDGKTNRLKEVPARKVIVFFGLAGAVAVVAWLTFGESIARALGF